MPGVSIDTFGASFIKYMKGVRKTLNNTTNARKIPKGTMNWTGKELHFFIHTKRNPAIGSIADGGALPVAGQQNYVEAKIARKFVAGSVQVTDGILKNAATTEQAAISIVESELTGLMDNIRKHDNFFFTRDGTGVVTTLAGTVSGATVTVDDARGLWDNKDYEVRDATTPTTIHTNFTVSSTARAFNASNEAVVTPSATVAASGQADGDYVVWGSGASSAYNKVFTGLDVLIDDSTSGTFQGLTMSSIPRYTSYVSTNSGTLRALTPALFRQVLATLKQESSSGDAASGLIVLSNLFQTINFEEMYEGELRLRPDDSKMGVSATTFTSSLGNVSLVTDPDSQYNRMFFIDPAQLVFCELAPLDWRKDGPGAPIFKRSDTFAGYTATALESNEMVILERNKCAKIEDLSETKSTAY